MKDFTLYPEALALRELGFDEPCFGYWNIDPQLKTPAFNMVKPFEHEWCLPAPTYSQAFRFFRDKHKLSAIVSQFGYGIENEYSQLVHVINEAENPLCYEEAELACLRKLIEIVKKA